MFSNSGIKYDAAILLLMNPPSLDLSRWSSLARLAEEYKLRELFKRIVDLNLSPILIKGWSVARFYDDERVRLSSDFDLLFGEDSEARSLQAIKELQSSFLVDAHFGPRHLDKQSFVDLLARSYEIELKDVTVRVLADEDNLRISATHWLLDGGVYRDKLWDTYYLVKNRRPDFNWDQSLNSSGPIRKTWVLAAIASARDYLALDVSELPGEVREFELPPWFAETLRKEWERGPYSRRLLSTVLGQPALLLEQLQRRFPPNKIAATIDAELPIANTSRIPAQLGSLKKKVAPFARGLGQRLTYRFRRESE